MLVMTLVVIGFIAAIATIGGSPAIAGHVVLPLLILLFFAWELGRWRMRRKYPLKKSEGKAP